MYGSLGLIGEFGRSGQARSAWRLSRIMHEAGEQDKADSYAKEAKQIREALGHVEKESLSQQDFDQLIGVLDQ